MHRCIMGTGEELLVSRRGERGRGANGAKVASGIYLCRLRAGKELVSRKIVVLKQWWTLSQRIRTFAEVPINAAILDAGAAPVHQQIASEAFQLQQLGMSNSAIARRLGITDKTVGKAMAWLWHVEHGPDG